MKRFLSLVLALTLSLALFALPASAKTTPAGQTVGTVLFTITNKYGDEILVSQIPVSEMEADMKAGKINATVYNYSLLDRFVTTVHQEAQGFTVPEFIEYAQSKTTVEALKSLKLDFSGNSKIRFWEIDQTGFDDLDTYTTADLYDTARFNFPLLYQYWDYDKQDYYDPAGKLTRAEVIDKIWANREPSVTLLSVRAFSQRYMVTDDMFRIDYNMENAWSNRNLLDNERTIRVIKPMTKDELYNKKPTASDSRYWTANIGLAMDPAPDIKPLGKVASPTAVMMEYGDYYYVRLSSTTPGATILYNHNFISPSYTPTSPYGDTPVRIPKEQFKSGAVTLTARAVKEGYTDAGVVTLTLTSSGTEKNPDLSADIADVTLNSDGSAPWYYEAVQYAMSRNLFDLTADKKFLPGDAASRAVVVTALYRLEGSPEVTKFADFSDVTKGTPLSAAVSWANANKIVEGNGDGTFAPNNNITREQIACIFYRYAKYKGDDLSASGDMTAFSDFLKTSSWATKELTWANGMKIINGMGNGTISPKGTATRAQIAQIIMNYAGKK